MNLNSWMMLCRRGCAAALLLTLTVGGTGCESTNADAGADTTGGAALTLKSVAKATAGNVEVELLATTAELKTGYQPIAMRVTKAGAVVTKGVVTLLPVMKMMAKQHGCPVVQPAADADAEGYFHGAIVPQMATMGAEGWEVSVEVTPDGGEKAVVAFGSVKVAAGGRVKTLIHGDGMAAKRYVVAADFPEGTKVGNNAIDVWVFGVSADMAAFPAVTDATLTMTPEMPAHGHGSSDNVAPAHTTEGRYRGSVNFSMPGAWTISLGLNHGGTDLGPAVFDVEL